MTLPDHMIKMLKRRALLEIKISSRLGGYDMERILHTPRIRIFLDRSCENMNLARAIEDHQNAKS